MTKTGLAPKRHDCLPRMKVAAVGYEIASQWQLPISESQYVMSDRQTLGFVHSALFATEF